MIRRSMPVALAVLAGAVLSGIGLAGASTGSGSDQTFRVRENLTSFATVDVGPAGLSPGDEALYHFKVHTLGGRPIGINDPVCTVLTPLSGGLAHCVGTARLTAGDLEWAGDLPRKGRRFRFSVTGGTGAFRGATGQIDVRWTNPPTNTKVLVTVHLGP